MGSQTTHAVASTIDCSPQIYGKTPLLNTMPMQLIEYEEVHIDPVLLGIVRYSALYQR